VPMKYRRFHDKVMVRIDKGEEIVSTMKQLCTHLGISLGSIWGIGATNDVTIGLMNTTTKTYQSTRFTGDHEISSLMGTITTMNGEVYLHFHITVCDQELNTHGGHLTAAVVSATFEGVITVFNGRVNRTKDPSVGLNLLDL